MEVNKWDNPPAAVRETQETEAGETLFVNTGMYLEGLEGYA